MGFVLKTFFGVVRMNSETPKPYKTESGIKLLVFYIRQDDPKKCTAVRLNKMGKVEMVHKAGYLPRNAVLLNPFSLKALSIEDLPAIQTKGLIGLDCSWVSAKKVFGIVTFQTPLAYFSQPVITSEPLIWTLSPLAA